MSGQHWPWMLEKPLLLASGSKTRRDLLTTAGIPVEIMPADLDERAVEAPLRMAGMTAADRALALARAKTAQVASKHKERIVIGADQTLDAAGHPGTKAADQTQAFQFIMMLSARRHHLHSAWCIAMGGTVVQEGIQTATLYGRSYHADFARDYIESAGDAVLHSVGCYQIEGLGQHLFDHIEGDHTTILGLPMPPVLEFLRRRGMIAA